ncbi:ino80 chromatin remodeling complex ies1-like protein [Diaporthe amygdali]|uniref:ino80 chromatin remodeling complex ies1-like protein n=1 Tax=Phomopsis amygdali TaxID=1214568 RepID=UPI0022FDD569|nr:ino80 chromatin remodeling complex ies1-like protein [Diaporthe amygdali]KAJ0114909.1 ino80 chromatin remodeling complex ies1-like protein [Diaporthe amygdali]
MAASPSSRAATPDEPPSSPPAHIARYERSFMTNVTEDEDRSKMGTPEPGTRRRGRHNANSQPSIGKVRHLKKDDGEPLWRVDIQYDFLKAVFDNEKPVFTNSWEPSKPKQCFADLYIDTMSRSSKTSKVLRDKLLSDREAAKGMAMVCLLVNIGRMNTTLNFFPEMRAQLRTYHAIPSLQARQDPNSYKQLQDAPRLKSILKGGSEDRVEPSTLDGIKQMNVPRTNPVNLLFVICASAAKIAELHFPPGGEFHDLIMKTDTSSTSRARAFLWIMWFYLESDFTEEGCMENPFGEGVDYGVDVANQGVPRLEQLSRTEQEYENVDTQEELDFGLQKQAMRKKIIEADQQYAIESNTKRGAARARMFPAGEDGSTMGILPRIRPSKHESDMDSVRSTPPPRGPGRHKDGIGSSRRGGAPLKYQIFEGSSPGGPQMIEGIVPRKPRPPTAHQIAVERNRSQRVEHILDRGIRKRHKKSRRLRKTDGAIIRAAKRVLQMEDPFEDSEGDENVSAMKHHLLVGPAAFAPGVDPVTARKTAFRERGLGGLVSLVTEQDDFGEEMVAYSAALRRATRRLDRWERYNGPDVGPVATIKKPRPEPANDGRDPDETEEELDATNFSLDGSLLAAPRGLSRSKSNGVPASSNGDVAMEDAEDLNEEDKELLGIASDREDGDGEGDAEDEELDDIELTMLGRKDVSDSE